MSQESRAAGMIPVAPASWKRSPYASVQENQNRGQSRGCRSPRMDAGQVVMDRDDNSAVNIYQRFLAWLGPHMERISMRCADVFTAIEDVNTCEHI